MRLLNSDFGQQYLFVIVAVKSDHERRGRPNASKFQQLKSRRSEKFV